MRVDGAIDTLIHHIVSYRIITPADATRIATVIALLFLLQPCLGICKVRRHLTGSESRPASGVRLRLRLRLSEVVIHKIHNPSSMLAGLDIIA